MEADPTFWDGDPEGGKRGLKAARSIALISYRTVAAYNQTQQEEGTAKQFKASIDALNHDPKMVERLVRERLGYAKPGETVIRFEEPATNSMPNR